VDGRDKPGHDEIDFFKQPSSFSLRIRARGMKSEGNEAPKGAVFLFASVKDAQRLPALHRGDFLPRAALSVQAE
jgi:hypothetical protein